MTQNPTPPTPTLDRELVRADLLRLGSSAASLLDSYRDALLPMVEAAARIPLLGRKLQPLRDQLRQGFLAPKLSGLLAAWADAQTDEALAAVIDAAGTELMAWRGLAEPVTDAELAGVGALLDASARDLRAPELDPVGTAPMFPGVER